MSMNIRPFSLPMTSTHDGGSTVAPLSRPLIFYSTVYGQCTHPIAESAIGDAIEPSRNFETSF